MGWISNSLCFLRVYTLQTAALFTLQDRRYSLTHVYKYLGSSVLTLYQRKTAELSSKCSAQHCKSRVPGHIQKHEQRTPHVLFVWKARYRLQKCPSMDPTPVNKNLVKFTKHNLLKIHFSTFPTSSNEIKLE